MIAGRFAARTEPGLQIGDRLQSRGSSAFELRAIFLVRYQRAAALILFKSVLDKEMHSATELRLARPRYALLMLGRAATLRCPHCGRGPVMRHWLKMRVRCGHCGLRVERGEHDYFVGSMMFNFIIAGLLLLAAIGVILVVSWPAIPWKTLEIVAPILMVAAPFVLFPFSKLFWLAFDLILRPVTPEEMQWHDAAEGEWST